ncbi:T6SS immunity protein Tli4 family protein [Massilia sp. 2TAF26]|uniref:T6SS immunity protein Tli4 family protein n=1 Tax=Massilia sp. 2TAF26 TaxID=3233012 RepID=UPI003F9D2154
MMKFSQQRRLATYFLIAFLFTNLLCACQRSTALESRQPMIDLASRLQPIFEKTRKVCFGRFLINVPATATIVYGPADIEVPIVFHEGEATNLEKYVAKRLSEIEEERQYLLKDDIRRLPLFGKIIDGAIPGQKIVFGSKNQAGYSIYSYIPVGNDLFVQNHDFALPEEDQVPMLNRIAGHLRSRSENEIPADPGVCIEGGFISLAEEREWVRLGVRIKEFPDVHLSIDMHKNLEHLRESNNPILLRAQAKEIAEADGLGAIFSRTKILREQPRQLNNWEGVELALRTPAYKDSKSVHEFRFHSVGAIKDPLHPELDIRLDTGVKDNSKGKVDPSLTDEEALMLWDKLISTIRVRQPSDATPPPTPQRVPLASLSRTGEPCPQTGWWECTETQKLKGSNNRRLLKAGELMPYAVLDGTSFWQKLTGQGTTHPVPTVWKLVAYDENQATPPTAG